ncbi:uncharacterized protein LOC129961784 [Argiope bruennichi]|uniref:Uncharacterized protein n=1 Tax=Argiope bruennichi TaxID=94029 RepID=A0A8T0FTW2_ARGBR|nr:uncharacterized protein LOC129961784 [Argiope bruennichi]XP_055931328.1 uncharacterized protein LOC129961784 [Argiope bruennichi]KAF8794531.1 hypothetical protein HNY73_002505 [Argiope bruennichi]
MLNNSDGNSGLPVGLSSIHCPNITKLLNAYLSSLSSNENITLSISDVTSQTPDPALQMAQEISQRNAVIYIVVVLFFYSFGIGIMMIKYMRKEAEEQEEFKMYRRYMSDTCDNFSSTTSRGRLANRLALQALNMVNAIPQTSQAGSKVTFV